MGFIYTFILIFTLFIFIGNCNTWNVFRNRKSCDKSNVVLFFAKYSPSSCSDLGNGATTTLNYLQLSETARVKHCANRLPKDTTVTKRGGCSSNCKQTLKSNLMTLISFARRVLQMQTAIITEEIEDTRYENQDKRNKLDLKNEEIDKRDFLTKDLITSPQHSEVFQIRSKRENCDAEGEPTKEVIDIPLAPTNPPKKLFRIVDYITSVQISFFGDFFNNKSSERPVEDSSDNPSPEDQIGQTRDSCLFDKVNKTLSTLLEFADLPFLLIVFGGKLSDVSNNQSPLVQSLKHVVENTNPDSTLLVLTASCAQPDDQNLNQGDSQDNPESLVPVFAKGPNSDKLRSCSELGDIPLAIKGILGQSQSNMEGYQGDGVKTKRSILGNIRSNKGAVYKILPVAKTSPLLYLIVYWTTLTLLL